MSWLIFVLFIVYLSWITCLEIALVNTTSGNVQGRGIGSIEEFLNIPYAVPPLGSLRFSKPQPIIEPRKGIIDGTKIGKECFQSKIAYDFKIPESEDCLVLNVWTKRGNKKLKPVMFFIHGGSFIWGTIFQPQYNASELANYGVVVVTVNYRLGPFGWLYGNNESAPGNVGLYDQRLALQWVKNNIHLFGGDSNQITIFGESAGGWSITAHLLSPLMRGQFKRAIFQSGTILENKYMPLLPKAKAYKEARSMATQFTCNDDNKWLDCLRRVDAKALNSYQNITSRYIFGTEYLPLTTQQALRSNQFNHEVDIMAGVVKDEGSLLTNWYFKEALNLHSVQQFQNMIDSYPSPNLDSERITRFYLGNDNTTSKETLKLAFYQFIGDIRIKCPTYLLAKLFAKCSPGQIVYFYHWTYASSYVRSVYNCTPDMGVCHQSEIPYIFGEPVRKNMADKEFSEYSMTLWTNFAKYGDPLKGFPSNYKWPRFIPSTGEINTTLTKEMTPFRLNNIIDNSFANNCELFWKNYFI